MGGFGFTEDGAKRVIRATKHVEQSIKGGGPGPRRYPVLSPSGEILCRIGPGGFSARVKDSPTPGTDTLGTGTVTRYETDGNTVTLAAESETATSTYFDAIDGDRDGWFSLYGDKLTLKTRHCQDAP